MESRMESCQATLNNKALTMFESITSVNPQTTPGRISRTDYEQMTDDEKSEFNKTYGERKWKSELHNRDSFIWLWEVYSGVWGDCGQKDPIKRHALEVKMGQFKNAIQKNSNGYPALRLDFSKYPFRSHAESVDWDD
jgi:hypothetical protein